jgi:hypothetical protein
MMLWILGNTDGRLVVHVHNGCPIVTTRRVVVSVNGEKDEDICITKVSLELG